MGDDGFDHQQSTRGGGDGAAAVISAGTSASCSTYHPVAARILLLRAIAGSPAGGAADDNREAYVEDRQRYFPIDYSEDPRRPRKAARIVSMSSDDPSGRGMICEPSGASR